MARMLSIACFLVLASIAGCSFNRADFVTGPNGKAQTDQMSDDGKTVGSVLKNGPHVGVSF